MAVMLSDLLRNLTFNRSAHCTQVSDQCPLGLLFFYASENDNQELTKWWKVCNFADLSPEGESAIKGEREKVSNVVDLLGRGQQGGRFVML